MRLLLVEDELRLGTLLKRRLEGEGFQVDLRGDGEAGLEALAHGGVDVAIVDVMLPGLDGTTLARRARTSGIETPIVLLTALGEVADRVKGLEAGADDYLGKPFAFEELVARIRALGRRTGKEPATLRSAALIMDLVAHEVRWENAVIELSPREYELLECFLRHPGQALSRRQLLDHVWDIGFESDTAVVDTYVHYLRRKLGAAGAPDPIRTVRGVGYAWRP